MNFPRIIQSIWSRSPQQTLKTPVVVKDIAQEVPTENAEVIVSKVGELLDKLPKGGSVELSESTEVAKVPQAVLKVGMQQAGMDARLSTDQKYTRKVKLKVIKN